MTLLTADILAKVGLANAAISAALLAEVATRRGIDTQARQLCWLPNVFNESGGLTRASEDLDYRSAEWISEVFHSEIPTATAAIPYVGNPVGLGNRVYAHLGPAAGGYAARGLGWGQLTGDSNHQAYAGDVGMTLAAARAFMVTPRGAADSAGWYFQHRGCAGPADRGDLLAVRQLWAGTKPGTVPIGWAAVQTWHAKLTVAMGSPGSQGPLRLGPAPMHRSNGETAADLNAAELITIAGDPT